MQYFPQEGGGGGAYAGYALCWIRHWETFVFLSNRRNRETNPEL